MSLSYNTPNSTPVRDGSLTQYYTNRACQNREWRSRRVVWVNGMQNTGEDHRAAGEQLSSLTESLVIGAYNQCGQSRLPSIADWLAAQRNAVSSSARYTTGGHTELGSGMLANALEGVVDAGSALRSGANNAMVALDHNVRVPAERLLYTAFERAARLGGTIQSVGTDIMQCAADFFGIWSAMMTSQVVRAFAVRYPDMVKAFVLSYFNYNPAVRGVIRLLTETTWPQSHCIIVAHSQGNLITSAALFAVAAINACSGSGIIPNGRCTVFAVASPAWKWPDSQATIKPYTNPGDAVTWLSLGRSYGVRPDGVARAAGQAATGSPVRAARTTLEALVGGVEFDYQGMLAHSFSGYMGTRALVHDLREIMRLPT